MVRACAHFCMRVQQSRHPSWLALTGPSGVGKTHCSKRVWKYASGKFEWGSFQFLHSPIYWPGFIQELRSGNVSYDKLSELSAWPVLFLDDIGAERDTTGFAAEQLNALFGQRGDKWTIVTSNLNLEQLAQIDPRIADRMIRGGGNEFVELTTTSYALRKVKSDGH